MKNIKILSAALFLEIVILVFYVFLYNFNFLKFKDFFVAATEWGVVGPKYPPRDLIVSVSDLEVKLTWIAPEDPTDVLGYKIYRCENSSECYPSKEIAITENSIFSYTDTTILSNTPYGYAVRAYGTVNLSPLSNIEHIVSNIAWTNSFAENTPTEPQVSQTTEEIAQQTINIISEDSPAEEIFTEKMYMGIKSEQVKQLQTFLAKYPDIYPEGLITGFFWSATYRAVGRFQIKYGIVDSSSSIGYGVVGPKTREELNEMANQ
jgi:peptidoglycan hydrolase-like protein with peptidoglycan-binding domain